MYVEEDVKENIRFVTFSTNIIQNSFTGYQFGPDVSNVMTSLIKTSVNVTSELDVETSELKTFRLTSREVIE